MKKRHYFLFLIPSLLVFAACTEKADTGAQWRSDNQAAYEAIKADTKWNLLDVKSNEGPDGIYYRNLTETGLGTGDEYPLQTASVTINYTGRYYTGAVFDSGIQVAFTVNSVVRGFSIALQNMRVGEKWEICIPYYLGYGVATSGSIPAYSMLLFEIELLKIVQYPK